MTLPMHGFQRPRGLRAHVLLGTCLLPSMMLSHVANAAPAGGVVAHGAGTITRVGNTTHIQQNTTRAVVDWQSFNLTQSEIAKFHQPTSQSVTINRVHDVAPSTIAGKIEAPGHVVITNPNGVLFTKTAAVDVGSLTVSTASVNDTDAAAFVAGKRNDVALSVAGNAGAKIINHGNITAKDAGLVGLVAPSVENHGIIRANKGKVTLASGDTATLDLYGDGLVSFAVSQNTESRLVANSGLVQADGGSVLLSAASAAEVANATIRVDGVVQANTVDTSKGRIILNADKGTVQITGAVRANGTDTASAGAIAVNGDFVALGGKITANGRIGGRIKATAKSTLSVADTVQAKGTKFDGGSVELLTQGQSWEIGTSSISVDGARNGGSIRHVAQNQIISSGKYSANGATGTGGSIDVSANSAKFLSASFNAKGQSKGGAVRLGGEYQGGKHLSVDELPNADYLVFDSGASINVSTTGTSGAGGTAILWSDQTTLALGNIQATPGTQSGAGGFVEISSAGELQYGAKVRTGLGTRSGTVLLDPKNIIIADSSFNPTAILFGYGYTGANNYHVDSLETGISVGYSVGLDGKNLVIGSRGGNSADGATLATGIVYMISFADENFNGASLQGIIGKGYTGGKNIDMLMLDSADDFGISVAIQGNRLAVGARYDDGANNGRANAGAVHLFTFSGDAFAGGQHVGTIGDGYTFGKSVNVSLNNADFFGRGIALDGNRLVVGANGGDGRNNMLSATGDIHLFTFADDQFSGGERVGMIGVGYTGDQSLSLDVESNDQLGNSLSLSGRMLAIGTITDNGATNNKSLAGAVYLISFDDLDFHGGQLRTRIGDGYEVHQELHVTNRFGSDVSLDGNRLAVGAYYDNGGQNNQNATGAAYLYSFDDDQFSNIKLEATIGRNYTGGKNLDNGAPASELFGGSVALQGNRLIVGATGGDGANNSNVDSGDFYLFTMTDPLFGGLTNVGMVGSGYTGAQSLDVAFTGPDQFGVSVSLDGKMLAVGTPYDDGFGNARPDAGAVYLYSFADENFGGAVLEGIIGAGYTGGKNYNFTMLDAGDRFGISLSLDNNRLAVGASNDDGRLNNRTNSGAVHLFTFTDSQFSGAKYESTIGFNYTGAKDYAFTTTQMAANDTFGNSVSLDGNRIAIGARLDDGFNNSRSDSGAVYLFTFADSSFSTPTLRAIIGNGYNDGYNLALDTSDVFGESVALSGNRLVVGAVQDDGKNNAMVNTGAVYLFTFSDTIFSDITHVGTIGHGYDGVNDVAVSDMTNSDTLGYSVALEGRTLAVGARGGDGLNNVLSSSGDVFIYEFANSAGMTGATLEAMLGYGFTGGKNVDVPGLNSSDYFGTSLSLSNGTLVVGAPADDGLNNMGNNSGAVYIFRNNANDNASAGFSFSSGGAGATIGITPGALIELLSTPQNVVLQASNDIRLLSDLVVDNPAGNGGSLTLHAGRSIFIDALLDSDNGNVNLYANEKNATGVVAAQRDTGAATITFGTNGRINAGTGNVHIRMDDGAGRTEERARSGNILLGNITAGSILVESAYAHSNVVLNGVLSASGAGNAIILAPGGNVINQSAAGAGALQLTNGASRWLIYSDHPTLSQFGGLTGQEVYDCAYNGCSTVPASGNALLYQYGQNLLRIGLNVERQYGDENPTNAELEALLTFYGFLGNDGWADIANKPTWSIANTSTTSSSAGTTHAITFTSSSPTLSIGGNNYSLYFDPSFLTVTKRNVTAQWVAPLESTYGDNAPVIGNGNFVFNGLVNGHTGAVFTPTVSFAGMTNAGSYTVGAAFDALNYTVTNAPTTTYTVHKKNVTATWDDDLTRTYGNANPTVNYNNFSFDGLLETDSASVITATANWNGVGQGTNVGTYTVGANFNAQNYNVVNAPIATLTIEKRVLTPTLTGSVSKTYDGNLIAALNSGNFALANVYGSDAVTIAAGFEALFANKDAGNGKQVNVSGLTLGGGKAGNYTLAMDSLSANIGQILKKAIGVVGVVANNKVYDGQIGAILSLGSAGLDGAVALDDVVLDSSTSYANFTNKNVGNGRSVTAGGFTLTGVDALNYTLSQPTGLSANITPKQISLIGLTANNKTYDGLLGATLNLAGASLSGVESGDSVGINSANAVASFASKNAENGKAVTVSGFGLQGTSADNYTLLQPTGLSADILQRVLNLQLTGSVSKTYNGNTNATLTTGNYLLNGLVSGDAVVLNNFANGSYADKNVGSGKEVSVSGLAITGTDAANYSLSSNSIAGNVGTINRANLVVTAASGLSKIYGDLDPGFTYSYTGLVGGDSSAAFTGALRRADGENAGSYAIGLGTLAATGNYQIGTYNGAGFTIDKRTIHAVVGNASREYGLGNQAYGWQDVTWSNLAAGENGSVLDQLTFSTAAKASSNAGTTHAVKLAGLVDNNYVLGSSTDGVLSITKANLLISANDASHFSGQPLPPFTASYSGLRNNDTASVVRGLAFETDANMGSVGSYMINPYGATAANYTIRYAPGTLTMLPATNLIPNSVNQARISLNISTQMHAITQPIPVLPPAPVSQTTTSSVSMYGASHAPAQPRKVSQPQASASQSDAHPNAPRTQADNVNSSPVPHSLQGLVWLAPELQQKLSSF
jgi:filamentous hemagglutinin family protein